MRVLVTGAAGHVGSAVAAELLAGGHDVVGAARSDLSLARIEALGADARRVDVADAAALSAAARAVDAVVHLAFDNEKVRTGGMAAAVEADLTAVAALGDALAGSGKTLIGVGLASTGDTELDRVLEASPRTRASRAVLELQDRAVRAMLIAIAPVTHSDRDQTGFIPTLISIARSKGVSGYVDSGENRWPAVHISDLAVLFRLALDNAPAGAQLTGVAEPGVRLVDIARAIGEGLRVSAVSIPEGVAREHFAPFPFATLDAVLPNDRTRHLLGWDPLGPTLLDDLASGHYFEDAE